MRYNNTNKVFKVNLETESPYFSMIFPLIVLIGLLTNKISLNSWPFLIAFLIVLTSYSVLMYRLILIEIDAGKEEVILLVSNLLKSKKTKKYPLHLLRVYL